jgi:hypothetical protein
MNTFLYILLYILMEKLNKIELLALIKTYNKTNDDKIKNVDKLKKDEIIEICKKYNLIGSDDNTYNSHNIDLRNISKKDLLRDVEIYYMKHNKTVPNDVIQMKKQDIIDFMELNEIPHYTSELVEKEIKTIEKNNKLKYIITYNIIRYDNVNVNDIDNEKMDEYITNNGLDTDISKLQSYVVLLQNLHNAYEIFCKMSNIEPENNKIKTLPKVIEKIKNLC